MKDPNPPRPPFLPLAQSAGLVLCAAFLIWATRPLLSPAPPSGVSAEEKHARALWFALQSYAVDYGRNPPASVSASGPPPAFLTTPVAYILSPASASYPLAIESISRGGAPRQRWALLWMGGWIAVVLVGRASVVIWRLGRQPLPHDLLAAEAVAGALALTLWIAGAWALPFGSFCAAQLGAYALGFLGLLGFGRPTRGSLLLAWLGACALAWELRTGNGLFLWGALALAALASISALLPLPAPGDPARADEPGWAAWIGLARVFFRSLCACAATFTFGALFVAGLFL